MARVDSVSVSRRVPSRSNITARMRGRGGNAIDELDAIMRALPMELLATIMISKLTVATDPKDLSAQAAAEVTFEAEQEEEQKSPEEDSVTCD